jgi:predicted O-methyltransferase YrrM
MFKKIRRITAKIMQLIHGYYAHFQYQMYLQKVNATQLDDHNLKNCKMLSSRKKMLELLPKNSIVAEIGVAEGAFTDEILNLSEPKKLYLIDTYGSNRYGKSMQLMVEGKFKKLIDESTIEILIGLSTDVLKKIENQTFDWVYLDTDHTYQTTKDELELLKSKVKEGGIIAGHDYSMFNNCGDMRYGVIEAVNEFVVINKWELIYLTNEKTHDRSFAIRKIRD